MYKSCLTQVFDLAQHQNEHMTVAVLPIDLSLQAVS